MNMTDHRALDTASPAQARLRRFRPANPALALGLAVSHLMGKPAFARLGFGAWSRVLVGQINRGHYQFVLDERDRVVGFFGWALTSEASADAWLAGRGFADAEARDGDCLVINAWSADTPAANRVVLDLAREVMHGRRLMLFSPRLPGRQLPADAHAGQRLRRAQPRAGADAGSHWRRRREAITSDHRALAGIV